MKRESGQNPELYPQLYAPLKTLVTTVLHHSKAGRQGGRGESEDLPDA